MNRLEKVYLFCGSLFLPFLFYRIYVFLNGGKVSFLRGLTGLKVHHYHYGVFLITVVVLLLLFYKLSKIIVVLAGLGIGTMLDSFISSLFRSSSRAGEIVNYNTALIPTLLLLLGVTLLAVALSRNSSNQTHE